MTAKPTSAPLITGILAAVLLLFGAYMGSYYLAMPHEPSQCKAWHLEMGETLDDHRTPIFWLAWEIDNAVRKTLGLDPPWGEY